MEIQLTSANYGRPRLGLPSTRLVNAYIEATPGGPTQSVRTTRPGLTLAFDVGTGPILATYQQLGLFGGDLFVISGSELYRCPVVGGDPIMLGSVAYSQNPQMAGADDQLAIVSGGGLYIYGGADPSGNPVFTYQQFFNDFVSLLPSFSGVTVLDNIWIFPVQGDNQFYFSGVGNPASLDAGNFGAAQTGPSPIVQSYVLADLLYFFNQTAVELWQFTGNLTAPFQVTLGSTYARGCAAQASVKKADNTLFWIGDDLAVYRTGTVPQRASTSFIEDRIRAEATAGNIETMSALVYNIEGHYCYVINLPAIGESYAFDCQTESWFRIGTQTQRDYDPGVFIGSVGTGQGLQSFVGSSIDGRVWTLDVNNHTDDGEPIQVVVSASVWITGGVKKNTNVSLQCVRGTANADAPEPEVFMRYSDDGGQTFTSWNPAQLAFIGSYRYKVTWRALGIVKQPGRVFEFAISDNVLVAIEGVSANEARV